MDRGVISRILLKLLGGLALCLSLGQQPVRAQEAVLDFKTTIDVRTDGKLEVYQRLRVRTERNLFKHGLVLNMPLSVPSPNGGRVQRQIFGVEVVKDEAPEPFSADELGNVMRLRTGGNRDLKPGEYIYDVRYLTDRQILFRDGEDELVVPVVPYDWNIPVQDTQVEIKLPDGLAATRVFASTGEEGARAGSVLVRREGGTVRVQATRPLPPGNGMFVSVSWAAGKVRRPGRMEQVVIMFKRYEHLAAPIGGIAVLCALGLLARAAGRLRPGKVKVQPPAGYSPGTIQFCADGAATFRGLCLTILGLGAKGYLTIEENEHGEFMLQRTWRDTDLGLSAVDRAVTLAFYQNRPTRFLINAQHAQELQAARRNMGAAAAKEFERAHVQKHPLLLGLILLVPVVAAMLTVLLSPASNWTVLFALMMLAGVAMLYMCALPSDPAWQMGLNERNFADLVATWATTRLGQAGLAVVALGTLVTVAKVGPLEAALLLLLGAVAAWIYHSTKKVDSLGGRREAGFSQLRDAVAATVDSTKEAELTPAAYESLLPYAAAWQVHPQWAERYRQMNNASGVPNQRPRWLTTPRTVTDPAGVAVLLVDGLTEAIERAATPGKR